MEHAYAQALWQLLERGMTPSRAVRMLYESLARVGRVSLLLRIGRAYERLAMRKNAEHAVVVTLADTKDVQAKNMAHKALTRVDAKKHVVLVREDDTLIGGWRLQGRGWVIDASYKKMLLDVYNGALSR